MSGLVDTSTAPERCFTCRFWLAQPEFGEHADGSESFGWCRRYPPTVLDHMARMTIPPLGNREDNYDPEDVATVARVHNATISPATYGIGWCGEYRGARS